MKNVINISVLFNQNTRDLRSRVKRLPVSVEKRTKIILKYFSDSNYENVMRISNNMMKSWKKRVARKGYNPATGKEIKIATSQAPKFKTGALAEKGCKVFFILSNKRGGGFCLQLLGENVSHYLIGSG